MPDLSKDLRMETAKYYDLHDIPWDDISFYKGFLQSAGQSRQQVLELGCGTGRVLVPLTESVAFIHGIDCSPAVIELCREKLEGQQIPLSKAELTEGDITNFDLGKTFDFIIAPFRVIQNIEETEGIDGLMDCIRAHLKADGTCILNVFMPMWEAERLKREWCSDLEIQHWEKQVNGKRVTLSSRQPAMNKETMVLYPVLIFRTYRGDILEDEAVLEIAMKCYYPDEFEELITSHGFKILNKWGGYHGEVYGEGPELVIQFTHMD